MVRFIGTTENLQPLEVMAHHSESSKMSGREHIQNFCIFEKCKRQIPKEQVLYEKSFSRKKYDFFHGIHREIVQKINC